MINARSIDRLKSGKLHDDVIVGLHIDATTKRKVWRYRRRIPSSTEIICTTLGSVLEHTIEDAKLWALKINESVEAGVNPLTIVDRTTLTVSEAHELYITYCKAGERRTFKPRTIADKEKRWRLEISPRLGNRLLSSVTSDDLWRMVENKAKTGKVQANRLAAELKVFFGWCRSRDAERQGIKLDVDPAQSLNGKYYRESAGRTRILDHDEIGWFVEAVMKQRNPSTRKLYMGLLLTGVRLNEIASAPSSEYRNGVWTISPERTKNSQPHTVTVGPWLKEIIGEPDGDWLIGQKFNESSLYSARDRIHLTMEKLAGRSLERWGHHDLRRTLRSNTFKCGIAFEIAEHMLNHTRKGLERRYDVSDLSVEAAEGWRFWETKVRDITFPTD